MIRHIHIRDTAGLAISAASFARCRFEGAARPCLSLPNASVALLPFHAVKHAGATAGWLPTRRATRVQEPCTP